MYVRITRISVHDWKDDHCTSFQWVEVYRRSDGAFMFSCELEYLHEKPVYVVN